MGLSGAFVAMFVIAVDIGLARLGYGLLLPAIRAQLGGGYAVYGLIGAVHLGGYLAGTIAAPRLLRDRARLPRVTASAHVVVATALAASAAAPGFVLLAAARVVLGVASGIGVASAVTDAFERVPPHRRGVASALAWSGIGVGLVFCAPAAIWTLDDFGAWRTATLIGAVLALAITVCALRLRPHRVAHGAATTANDFRWRKLVGPENVFFVASYAAYGIAYIAYATFAVAAFARRGLIPLEISAVWGAFGLAAVLGAAAISRVLAGAAHRWSMVMPLAASAAGALVSTLPFVATAVGGTLCVGIGLAAAPAVASAFARDRSDARSYAHAFAGVTMVFGVGQILGPIIAGGAADAFGLDAVPFIAAATFGIGALCAAIDARRHVAARLAAQPSS